jgi:hypothetical protein
LPGGRLSPFSPAISPTFSHRNSRGACRADLSAFLSVFERKFEHFELKQVFVIAKL